MTTLEFSDLFDLLYNNIASNQAPGLDEYEKSVFLTKALDEIIKSYFNPKLNKPQEGFDGSERRQIDFSMLVKVVTSTPSETTGNIDKRTTGVKVITMPTDALMILNEITTVTRNSNTVYLQTIPLKYTEYTRLMCKPYARPLKKQAWRLQALDSTTSEADIIAGNSDTIISYEVRYIKRPKPIILANLEGVTIDSLYTVTECELDNILHHEILQRAVELAKAAYTGDLTTQIALGQSSETNMGIVAQAR